MIPERNPYNNWNGNGSTKTFDFDFLIEDETQLVKYNNSSRLQERIKKVDSFETLYKVSIEKVVASISSSGDFDFKAVGADVNGQVLEEVKSLINGGVTI